MRGQGKDAQEGGGGEYVGGGKKSGVSGSPGGGQGKETLSPLCPGPSKPGSGPC